MHVHVHLQGLAHEKRDELVDAVDSYAEVRTCTHMLCMPMPHATCHMHMHMHVHMHMHSIQVLELEPDAWRAHFHLAKLHLNVGLVAAAAGHLKATLEVRRVGRA